MPNEAFRYHERTKHRFTGYAKSPDTLDWDMQPNPFRTFGAERVDLELAPENPDKAPFDVSGIGALLHLAMGLSAWKEFGPDRWALRCNPSSGNLHPTEAYVVSRSVAGLTDGLHHYAPRDHALETRRIDAAQESGLADATPRLWIGLSTIHWREAWKYGERAFRYCQLDLGHALGAFSTAAACLGWRVRMVEGLDSDAIGHLLGLDRAEDFGRAEKEEADALLEVFPASSEATGLPPEKPNGGVWQGVANLLDRHPMYRWPVIDEVAMATRGGVAPCNGVAAQPGFVAEKLPSRGAAPYSAEILLQRRSAQHFDPEGTMSAAAFFASLDALLVRPEAPWDVWTFPPRVHPILFVHRVEGLSPGLYALPRTESGLALLRENLDANYQWTGVAEAPAHLPFYLLNKGDARGAARRLFCNQAIASNACFGVAMLAEFEPAVRENPWLYRALHWEAGLIGQALYLEAEVLGLRGTGVGCFFDDETHGFLGMKAAKLQTLYHFTLGRPLTDDRIATAPAYPDKLRRKTF